MRTLPRRAVAILLVLIVAAIGALGLSGAAAGAGHALAEGPPTCCGQN